MNDVTKTTPEEQKIALAQGVEDVKELLSDMLARADRDKMHGVVVIGLIGGLEPRACGGVAIATVMRANLVQCGPDIGEVLLQALLVATAEPDALTLQALGTKH